MVSLWRPKTVYGAPIRDLPTGTVRIDYVGKTIRPLPVRELEHRGMGRNPEDEQPWSDLVVGPFIVLEQDTASAPWTDADLKAKERWWISTGGTLPHRPRYNWEFNAGCPGHIPKWEAAAARKARDEDKGVVSRWTNPELFAPRTVDPTRVPARVQPLGRSNTLWRWFWASPVGRWLSWRLRQAGTVVGWWLTLTVGGTAAILTCGYLLAAYHKLDAPFPADGAALTAAVAVTAGMVRRWWGRKGRSRRHRTRRRTR